MGAGPAAGDPRCFLGLPEHAVLAMVTVKSVPWPRLEEFGLQINSFFHLSAKLLRYPQNHLPRPQSLLNEQDPASVFPLLVSSRIVKLQNEHPIF